MNDVPQTYRYAMTAPYYVEFDYQPRISKQAAQFFLDWVYQRARQIAIDNPKEQAAPGPGLSPPGAGLLAGAVVEGQRGVKCSPHTPCAAARHTACASYIGGFPISPIDKLVPAC